MVKIVVISNTGELSDVAMSKFNENDIYKKCNFRKNDGFEKRHTWKVKYEKKSYNLEVWARNHGKANQENKYDLPPPVDNELYFGRIAVVAYVDNKPCDISSKLWEKLYEELMGGFEDLSETAYDDENESDELENISQDMKTDHGYLKDGFVVNDGEIELNENSYDDGSELEEEDYDTDEESE